MKDDLINKMFADHFPLSQKVNDMGKEKQKETSYLHEAEKVHTDLYLQDKHTFLKFTPENLKTFQLGFVQGLAFGAKEMGELLTPTIVRNEKES